MAKIKESYTREFMLAHDLIGGKWKVHILWHIIHGNNRYSMLLREIPDISQKVLGSQLKELVESGLLEKIVLDNHPPKVIEYRLAMNQKQLITLVEDIYQFTKAYVQQKNIKIKA